MRPITMELAEEMSRTLDYKPNVGEIVQTPEQYESGLNDGYIVTGDAVKDEPELEKIQDKWLEYLDVMEGELLV